MPRKKPVNPPARLEPRDNDVRLPGSAYLACSLFARMKSKPNLDKFPNALVLRKYRKGEIICRQGDEGWTAFYTLTPDDVRALAPQEKDVGQGPIATIYVESAPEAAARARGWLARLFGGGPKIPKKRKPRFISAEGAPVAYGTRKATIPEGKRFGDWSCVYGPPRSATIIADRTCYLIEMLRNVLDQVLKDKSYQESADREYKESLLANHLVNLEIFSDLSAEQVAEVQAGVELERLHDGQVIFDKGAESDCMYIVRRGLVKVLDNEWPLLGAEDVRSWTKLAALASESATPAQKAIGAKLPEAARGLLGKPELTEPQKRDIISAVNEVLKNRKLADDAELKKVVGDAAFKQVVAGDFPKAQVDG